MGYLRLKVLESFFLLSQMLPQESFETAAYYSAAQIKKVKALKAELMEHLDTKETLKSVDWLPADSGLIEKIEKALAISNFSTSGIPSVSF